MSFAYGWLEKPWDIAEPSSEKTTVNELLAKQHATVLSPKSVSHLLRSGRSLYELSTSFAHSRYHRLMSIQQNGEINSSPVEAHYERHLWRMCKLVSVASGRALDIGCGDPLIGAALFKPNVSYVGIDPFAPEGNPHALRGVAEDLPFDDAVFNVTVFNTSLDHVLDYVTALDEARRVLTTNGSLFLATLVWTDRYSLVTDQVHFHHFKQFEISGALKHCGFEVVSCSWYRYKTDTHRVGLYLHATAR